MISASRKSTPFRRFLRSYRGRIIVALALGTTIQLIPIMQILVEYQTERRIARNIEAAGGDAYSQFSGPDWIPVKLRPALSALDRLCVVEMPKYDLRQQEVTYYASGELLQEILSLRRLHTLSISGSEVTNADLGKLKGLLGIWWLDLSRTEIGDEGLQQIKGLTTLQELRIHQTRVSDAGLESLTGLDGLRHLNLFKTKVGDNGMQYLKVLKKLEDLDLRDTYVTDAGLEELKGMSSLRYLALKDTVTTSIGRAKLRRALRNCHITPE